MTDELKIVEDAIEERTKLEELCPLEPGPGVVVIVRDSKKRQTKSGIYMGKQDMCTGIVHATGSNCDESGNAWWDVGDRILTAGYTEYSMLKHNGETYEVVPFGNVIARMRVPLDSDNFKPVIVQQASNLMVPMGQDQIPNGI